MITCACFDKRKELHILPIQAQDGNQHTTEWLKELDAVLQVCILFIAKEKAKNNFLKTPRYKKIFIHFIYILKIRLFDIIRLCMLKDWLHI